MEYIKLDEFDVVDMCSKMKDAINRANFHPECIVAILEGGFIPAKNLANLLSISNMYSVKIKKYDNDGNRLTEGAEIVEHVSDQIRNKRVLVVDDVCETGESLNLAINDVKKYTDKVIACVLVAKDNWTKVDLDDIFCPFARTFKLGTWTRFYWEDGY